MTSAPEPRTCPGRHAGDARPELGPYDFLCRDCAGRASRTARHLPELYDDLEETLSGLGRTGPRSGAIGSGGESKVLMKLAAPELRAHTIAIVALATEVGYQPDAFTFSDTCAAIASAPQRIRCHATGPDLARQIHKARADWRRTIDPDGERVRSGRCPNCSTELWSYRDSEWTSCTGCGIEYPTAQLLAGVTAAVHDWVMPPNEVRKVIADRMGWRVNPATVRKWRERMRLPTWCRVEDREVVCRVGDFVALAEELRPAKSPDSIEA